MNRAPELLAVKITGLLPQIVRKRKQGCLSSRHLCDGTDSGRLVIISGTCLAVAFARRRPSTFQVDTGLACTEIVDDLELAGDE